MIQSFLGGVLEKLSWVEEHRYEILKFALGEEDFLYGINEAICSEVAKKGSFKLHDGTILKGEIDEDTLMQSMFIDSIYLAEGYFSIDLTTSPDYLGVHFLEISVSMDDYEMEFEGVNG